MYQMKSSIAARLARVTLAALAACVLAACAGTTAPDEINDPFERTNRSIHAFNRGLDRAVVGPASKGFGAVVPEPAKRVIGNFANTLDLPGDILNNVMQLNIEDAATNTLRLATNVTMGVGGIFDAATAIGLPSAPTDFGETLHVWGVGEGAWAKARSLRSPSPAPPPCATPRARWSICWRTPSATTCPRVRLLQPMR